MDKPRKIVGNLVKRMYKHSLTSTGKLPTGKEVKIMEHKAKKTALRIERNRNGK